MEGAWAAAWAETSNGVELSLDKHVGRFTGTATALLVAIGALALWRKAPRRPLLWLLLGPLPVALTAAALRRYPYGVSTRLMLYLAPAVCLLAAEGVVAVLRSRHIARLGATRVALALAVVPIACTFCDVCTPYRRRDDLAYREFVRGLAERTAPGDRYVVFDGADVVPREAWVMTSVWVQRVARLRYYLLSLAPVPSQWGINPRQIEPNPRGRTWLILHDHGFKPIYPHAARSSYEPIFAARLGPARSTRHRLPVGSTVEIHEFPPASVAVTAHSHSRNTLRRR